ncbi:MAG: tetratricopeptide repeat protein [Bryobacterales bacterium]|nr:tetratricopeptide repeat protein [Bryobacterales bacterium]
MRRPAGWVICAVLSLRLGVAEPSLERRGFDHFYNLEFDEAISTFEKAVAAEPASPDARNHLAQSILYREMLKAGALESELVSGGNAFLRREKMNPSAEDQRRFDEAIARAMSLAQAVLQAKPDDLESLHALGISYGLRANYNFLVRKAWMDSLRDATQSRKYHHRITELDPTYVDALLVQGVHDYIVGNLPWHYKMLGFLVGFRGDREKGIRTLETVAAKGNRTRDDAAILLAVVYRRERKFGPAIALLDRLIPKYPRNYLLRLELAQMHSDNGNGEAALRAIAEVEKLKIEATPGFARLPVEKILYYRGTVKFWYRDYPGAIADLQRVTTRAGELDPNTGVTAWMRLGQAHDLRGEREKALECYRRAVAYAPESGVARECQSYLRRPFRRTDE